MSIDHIMGNFARHPQPEEAEVKLDLTGKGPQEALALLDTMIKNCQKTATPSLYVYFDPATAVSGKTLFQPVGNHLRLAKKQGIVNHCSPVIKDDVAGFFVVFKL